MRFGTALVGPLGPDMSSWPGAALRRRYGQGRGWAGLNVERVLEILGCKRDLQLARGAHSPHQSMPNVDHPTLGNCTEIIYDDDFRSFFIKIIYAREPTTSSGGA